MTKNTHDGDVTGRRCSPRRSPGSEPTADVPQPLQRRQTEGLRAHPQPAAARPDASAERRRPSRPSLTRCHPPIHIHADFAMGSGIFPGLALDWAISAGAGATCQTLMEMSMLVVYSPASFSSSAKITSRPSSILLTTLLESRGETDSRPLVTSRRDGEPSRLVVKGRSFPCKPAAVEFRVAVASASGVRLPCWSLGAVDLMLQARAPVAHVLPQPPRQTPPAERHRVERLLRPEYTSCHSRPTDTAASLARQPESDTASLPTLVRVTDSFHRRIPPAWLL